MRVWLFASHVPNHRPGTKSVAAAFFFLLNSMAFSAGAVVSHSASTFPAWALSCVAFWALERGPAMQDTQTDPSVSQYRDAATTKAWSGWCAVPARVAKRTHYLGKRGRWFDFIRACNLLQCLLSARYERGTVVGHQRSNLHLSQTRLAMYHKRTG